MKRCNALLVLVAILTADALSAADPVQSRANRHRSDPVTKHEAQGRTVLATRPGEQLSLVMEQLPPLNMAEKIRYMTKHKGGFSVPNLVFLLVKRQSDDMEGGPIGWLTYGFQNERIRPLPAWFGDVATDSTRGEVFVVLTKSIGSTVAFEIHLAAMRRDYGEWPLTFDATNYELWPKASDTLVSKHSVSLPHDSCGISRTKATLRDRKIEVEAVRSADCTALIVEHDLETKEWNIVSGESEPE